MGNAILLLNPGTKENIIEKVMLSLMFLMGIMGGIRCLTLVTLLESCYPSVSEHLLSFYLID